MPCEAPYIALRECRLSHQPRRPPPRSPMSGLRVRRDKAALSSGREPSSFGTATARAPRSGALDSRAALSTRSPTGA